MRKERVKVWKSSRFIEVLIIDFEDMGDEFVFIEGGKDFIICDVGYYVR